MSFQLFVGRYINRVLRTFGLEMGLVNKEFEARLTSDKHLSRMFSMLAESAADFLSSQNIIQINNKFDIEAEIRAFYDAYLDSPYTSSYGGSRIGNLLWLDLIAKWAQPNLIIDSGTHRGASAWALAQGAPDARILSFDIDLSRLASRCKNVEYIERDWTTVNYDNLDTSRSLCYFDDHIDQSRRLKEAADRRFPLAIFDDDFTVFSFAPMAHGGLAIPKISFLLDETLKDGEIIEWVEGRQRFSWTVDRARLDSLKDLIRATVRLPNLVAPLAIDQLPYRIVAIKDASSGCASESKAATAVGT